MSIFLPFIGEDSTPLHIYTTLLARSKGVNELLVLSVFNSILALGINEIRKTVDSFSPREEIYKTLAYKTLAYTYHDKLVDNDKYLIFQGIIDLILANDLNSIDSSLHENFNSLEIAGFFVVVVNNDLYKQYSRIDFSQLNNLDVILKLERHLIPLKLFDSTSPVYVNFANKLQLSAYIYYWALLTDAPLRPSVKAVFTP